MSNSEKKYHTFQKATMMFKDLLPMIRSAGYSNYDESGTSIILCPECEEWTWVKFNQHSGMLDLLGDLIVSSIDAEDGNIKLWIETKEFNYFLRDEPRCPHCGGKIERRGNEWYCYGCHFWWQEESPSD